MNKNELRNTILSQIQLPCIGKNRMQVEPVPGQMQTRQLQQAIDDSVAVSSVSFSTRWRHCAKARCSFTRRLLLPPSAL